MSTASFDRLASHITAYYIAEGVPPSKAEKWGTETAGKVRREKDAKAKRTARKPTSRTTKQRARKG